jgi:threonine dehydrogenase-like Zn-dependent dehydrogenase
MALAKRLVRPRGTIVLKSTYAPGATAMPVDDARLVIDEVAVVGSRCGPFAAALRLLARRLVDVRALITARYPLSEGIAAFERAKERETLKVILRCGDDRSPRS